MTIKESLSASKKIIRAKMRTTKTADARIVRKAVGGKKLYGNSSRNRKKPKSAIKVTDGSITPIGRETGNTGTGVQAVSGTQAVSAGIG